MSGYSSKAEAMEVLQETLEKNPYSLPKSTNSYYMNRLFDANFAPAGYGRCSGWRNLVPEESEFVRSLVSNMRPSALHMLPRHVMIAAKNGDVTKLREI